MAKLLKGRPKRAPAVLKVWLGDTLIKYMCVYINICMHAVDVCVCAFRASSTC